LKILVVDDDKNMRTSIKRLLEIEGIDVECAENGLSAQRLLENSVFSAAVVDLKMPGLNGLELLKWIKDEGLRIPVVMVSAYGEIDDAVNALKYGASDYIVKPFSSDELLLRLNRIVEDQKLKNAVESGKHTQNLESELIGNSESVRKIKSLIEKIAQTPTTVLITGESGTGKEVAARMIHRRSSVCEGPFIPVNIGGIPESLVESELFGYEKGAFTGAVERKPGMFELASYGTLFLDEIGEMPPALQVKLLRVIQEHRIMRLGGTQLIPVNVRIISATNRNLEYLIEKKMFREDLYYRLNVVNIEIPPLRERLEDIPMLTGSIIEKLNRKIGKKITGITGDAVKKLKSYNFPGNVRELENILERAFIFAEGETITASDMPIDLPGNINAGPGSLPDGPVYGPPYTLKALERYAIKKALHRWEGNKTKAAEELGISRRTIINKIKEYGIE